MVCTMSSNKVKVQEASKAVSLESWGTLVEAKVIVYLAEAYRDG